MSNKGLFSLNFGLLAVLCLGVMGNAAALAQSQQPEAQRDTELVVVFGIDKEGGVVLQSGEGYLAALPNIEVTNPVVGDPVCREFRSPCPDSAQEESTALFIKDSVAGPDMGWNIDLGEPSGRTTKIAVSGGSGIQPRVGDLGTAWTVVGPERTAENEWGIEISPTDTTPVVGQPDGCWFEAECPEEPAKESKDD